MSEIRFYRSTGPHGFLSNLYRCPVVFDGHLFRSSEDAYQFGKPRKPEVAVWLVSAPAPHLCAAAAHSLFGFDVRPDWATYKLERMRAVLAAKFDQNTDLRARLLATGTAALIELSKTDPFWGVGAKGNGKNMLGAMLMELREELAKKATRP